MDYVAPAPTFLYAYSCEYKGTGCIGIAMKNFKHNITPTIDELKDEEREETQNEAMSEIAITCESISQGTAYDLLGPNSVKWIINGGRVMKNNIINKEKYEQINKSYDNFITMSIVSFVIFGLLALTNPFFFPRALSFTAILVIIPGTIGLLIDRKSWKGKFQCQ